MYDYLPFAATLCVGVTASIVWALARKVGKLQRTVEAAMDVGCRRHQSWAEGSAQMTLRIETLRQAIEHADAEANVRRMLRATKQQTAKADGGKP